MVDMFSGLMVKRIKAVIWNNNDLSLLFPFSEWEITPLHGHTNICWLKENMDYDPRQVHMFRSADSIMATKTLPKHTSRGLNCNKNIWQHQLPEPLAQQESWSSTGSSKTWGESPLKKKKFLPFVTVCANGSTLATCESEKFGSTAWDQTSVFSSVFAHD